MWDFFQLELWGTHNSHVEAAVQHAAPSTAPGFVPLSKSLTPPCGVQLSPGVLTHPERHTMLWVPHPVVIPGARFREVYYWDSYWVVKGLLVSGLTTLAQVGSLCMLCKAHVLPALGSMRSRRNCNR